MWFFGAMDSTDGGLIAYDDVTADKTYWFRKDHLGSVRWIEQFTEAEGAGGWEYDAFGNITEYGQWGATPDAIVSDGFNRSNRTGLDPAWTGSGSSNWRHWSKAARPSGGTTGLALRETGEVEGTVTGQYVATANGGQGYDLGLVARGGEVTLWVQSNGQMTLKDASGTGITLATQAGWTTLKDGQRVDLSISGSTATIRVNDVVRATASLPSNLPAGAGAKTEWGITFKSTVSGGASPIPGVNDGSGWDAWWFRPASNPPRFLYTGYEWDPETGLYYAHARYYDPAQGRFISQDPAPPTMMDARNLYPYAWNDPINMIDPTGLGGFKSMAMNGGSGYAVGSAFGGFLGGLIGGAIGGALGGGATTQIQGGGADKGVRSRNVVFRRDE